MIIRQMKANELDETLRLIHDVFMEYEAPDYSQQGVDTFLDFIEPSSIWKSIENGEVCIWVANEGNKNIGALAVRNANHICLLFVDGQQHRRGIATKLMKAAFSDCNCDITVNSSPYGADFYHAVGFVDTDALKETHGILHIPMVCKCGTLKV